MVVRRRVAVVRGGIVVNFIIIRDDQIPEFSSGTVSIIDPGTLGVQIGDTWDGERFYRDGIQLPAGSE